MKDLGQFLDNSIEDLHERAFLWSYNLNADAKKWDNVLKDKWNMLVHYQKGE